MAVVTKANLSGDGGYRGSARAGVGRRTPEISRLHRRLDLGQREVMGLEKMVKVRDLGW